MMSQYYQVTLHCLSDIKILFGDKSGVIQGKMTSVNWCICIYIVMPLMVKIGSSGLQVQLLSYFSPFSILERSCRDQIYYSYTPWIKQHSQYSVYHVTITLCHVPCDFPVPCTVFLVHSNYYIPCTVFLVHSIYYKPCPFRVSCPFHVFFTHLYNLWRQIIY